MDPHEPQPDLPNIVTPEDIEALAMSNTNACDLPPNVNDDAQAGEGWD